ncbi:MAG: hypothetical protein AB1529_07230 [Candidatus Micrarchaeota archaeon]
MRNTIDDINKSLRALDKLQNIMLKPQTLEAFNKLSASVERLSGQLTSLNSAVLEQNRQLGESIKEIKQQTIELRQELEKLNEVSSKSHGIFERMDRSSDATEQLSRVATAIAALGIVGVFYPVFKDISQTPCWAFLYATLLAIGVVLALQMLVKWKKENKNVVLIMSSLFFSVAGLLFFVLVLISNLFGFGAEYPVAVIWSEPLFVDNQLSHIPV